MSWSEAVISINGKFLTVGQSMTVRCAIESFAEFLVSTGLGEDDVGKEMTVEYLSRISEIRKMLVQQYEPEGDAAEPVEDTL